jgi:hypothetical protein
MSPAPALNGEEEVEAVARAIFHAEDAAADWDYFSDTYRDKYRRLAVAAIEALAPADETTAVERVRAFVDEFAERGNGPITTTDALWIAAIRRRLDGAAIAARRPEQRTAEAEQAVERVRALAEEWESGYDHFTHVRTDWAADRIRAALGQQP